MEDKSNIEQRLEFFAELVCNRWDELDHKERYYFFHGIAIGLILAQDQDRVLIDEIEVLRDISWQSWTDNIS